VQFGADYIEARYLGTVSATAFVAIGIIATYATAGLGGFLTSNTRSWAAGAAFIVVSFVPSALSLLVYGDKGAFFLCLAFLYGGLTAGWVAAGKTGILTRRGTLVSALGLFVLGPIMFAAIVIKTVGKWHITAEILELMSRTANSYAFGSLYAFGDWFRNYTTGVAGSPYADPENPMLGFWTFLGIGERVRPDYPVPDGYFAEYFRIPGVLTTNIYTMFRGLIYDFGSVGGLLFMLALGYIMALAYRFALEGRFTAISYTALILMGGFTWSSYLLSIGSWATIYVTMALICAAFYAAQILPLASPKARSASPSLST